MAENQQLQYGCNSVAARLGQQQQDQEQNGDVVSSNGTTAGQVGQGPEQRRDPMLELRDGALLLYKSITIVEELQMSLASQRASLPDATFHHRASIFEQDLATKTALLAEWNKTLTSNGMPSVPGAPVENVQGSNLIGPIPQYNVEPQVNWPPQQNRMPGIQQGAPQPPLPFQQVPPGQGQFNQNAGRQLMVLTRPILPLDRNRFQGSYQHFCQTKNLIVDERMITIQNRMVDLHALHVEVMRAGGCRRVVAQGLWPVIGGKLGYVQFPGNETEPPRSDPQVAQRLEQTYTKYLSLFDNIFIASYIQEVSNKRLSQQAQLQNFQGQPEQPLSQGIPGQYQQMPAALPRPGVPNGTVQINMNALIQYAYIPTVNLRMKGLPENIIQYINERRNALQQAHDRHLPARNMQNGQIGGHPVAQAMQNPPAFRSVQPGPATSLPGAAVFGGPHALSNGGPGFIQGNVPFGQLELRATQQEMNTAALFVQRAKGDLMLRVISMQLINVPDEQMHEYNQALDTLWRFVLDVDPKLTVYALLSSENVVKNLIIIVLTIQQQKALLSLTPPKYIIELETVRSMITQIQQAIQNFHQRLSSTSGNSLQQQQPALRTQSSPTPDTPLTGHSVSPSQSKEETILPLNYGSFPANTISKSDPRSRDDMIRASLKIAAILFVAYIVFCGIFWLAFPTLASR